MPGGIAVEKNIKAFLDLDLPGTKWVVGGGPQLKELQRRYKDARFFGSVDTEELSARYAQADCFVFPSRTDTFGLVMVEALASGVPVAGYPVPGPLDVVTTPKVGALNEDLRTACLAAINCDPADCRAHAETFTWAQCADPVPQRAAPDPAQHLAAPQAPRGPERGVLSSRHIDFVIDRLHICLVFSSAAPESLSARCSTQSRYARRKIERLDRVAVGDSLIERSERALQSLLSFPCCCGGRLPACRSGLKDNDPCQAHQGERAARVRRGGISRRRNGHCRLSDRHPRGQRRALLASALGDIARHAG